MPCEIDGSGADGDGRPPAVTTDPLDRVSLTRLPHFDVPLDAESKE